LPAALEEVEHAGGRCARSLAHTCSPLMRLTPRAREHRQRGEPAGAPDEERGAHAPALGDGADQGGGDRAPRTFWLILAGPRAPLGLRHLAQQLVEAPAVALEVERLVGAMCLVGAIAPGVVAQPFCDPCTGGDRALIVR